jgi:prepilin peptidase CpaA
VGALAGLKVAIAAVLTIAVVGGVQALLYLLRKRLLGKTLKGMAQDAAAKVGVGEKTEREKTYVPYGVAIAIGTVWAYWWVLTQEHAALAALQAAGG